LLQPLVLLVSSTTDSSLKPEEIEVLAIPAAAVNFRGRAAVTEDASVAIAAP
jgi:hypothetical protein